MSKSKGIRQKCLYLAVTPDKYELPLIVTPNIEELAFRTGKTVNMIRCSISRNRSGEQCGIKFVKVAI